MHPKMTLSTSFIILLTVALAAGAEAQPPTRANSPPSIAPKTTRAPEVTVAAIAETTTTETTTSTATEPPTTSRETTTFSTDPAESTDNPTSTTDSLSVNEDEADAGTIVTSDNDNTGDSLPGIEPKSINSAAPTENSLSGEPNAKLVSIDNSESSETTTSSDSNSEDNNDGETTTNRPAKLNTRLNLPSRLNMSQIDAMYVDGTRDERDTVESWRRMGKKLKKGIGNIIGQLVPMALNMSAEAKISSDCSGAMLKWVLSMNQLKSWALRMLDAAGKPVAGLLEGSMTMFGNYRQCLKLRAPDDDEIEFTGEFREYFRGKYCIIQAKPWLPEKSRFYNLNTKLDSLMKPASDSEDEAEPVPWYDKTVFDELSEWALAFNFVNIRYDLCVPSLCSREDIQKAVNYLVRGIDLKARVLRCEMEAKPAPGNSSAGFFDFSVAAKVETGSDDVADALMAASASTDPSHKRSFSETFGQLGWLLLPLIAMLVVLLATVASAILGDDDDDKDEMIDNSDKVKLRKTINSLSLKRSVSSHLNVDYDQLADDKPLALYGLRFILVLWVLLVESAVNLKFEYLRELMMLKDLIFWWPMQVVINSTLQFDSIILLTAFTMGYKNCLNDGVNQAKALTRYVIDKYNRLMPSIMVMVALVILLPLIYRGPVWNDYVSKQSAVCQSTGWLNAVFLQNYLPFKEICLPQTWLVCVEFQLVFLMAPVLYYLNEAYCRSYYHSSNYKNNLNANGFSFRSDDKSKRHMNQHDQQQRHQLASKPLFWLRTFPGLILLACIFLGMASSFYSVYINELPPSFFYTMADPDSKAIYFGQHLTKLWTHLAVFGIGILAGVECRRSSKNVLRNYRDASLLLGVHNQQHQMKSHSSSSASLPATTQSGDSGSLSRSASDYMNRAGSMSLDNSTENIDLESAANLAPTSMGTSKTSCLSVLLNIISFLLVLVTMGAIIFSTHDWSLNNLPPPLIAAAFDVGSRIAWSMAFIWILYMVSVPDKNRNFSLCARLLGHPAMVCLGKLSFLIYLIHPFVHLTVLAIQEQPIYSNWFMLFHILIGNITITVILSSLVSLFVEMPCRNLFRRCGTSMFISHQATPTTTTTNSPQPPNILTMPPSRSDQLSGARSD